MNREEEARIERVALIIGQELDLAAVEATALAHAWWKNVREMKQRWLAAAQATEEEVLRASENFGPVKDQPLVELARQTTRGIVLCTIHMGDYLGALASIVRHLPERPLIIVRRRKPDAEDAPVFARLPGLGVRSSQVISTSEPAAAWRVMQCLARGGVAVMFYDLPSRFGRAAPVNFLGREVWWVKGPVTIAAACNALLLPFVAFRDPATDRDRLTLCTPLDFERTGAPASERAAVMQWLASIAESHVRAIPDQWLHWSLMPSMLEPEDASRRQR